MTGIGVADVLRAQAPVLLGAGFMVCCVLAVQWALRDETHRIERTFQFRNFRQALTFVQEVGELAEDQGHHPDISFGWGYATISLRTKKIKGLHENDFIMAGRIDRLFDRELGSS